MSGLPSRQYLLTIKTVGQKNSINLQNKPLSHKYKVMHGREVNGTKNYSYAPQGH